MLLKPTDTTYIQLNRNAVSRNAHTFKYYLVIMYYIRHHYDFPVILYESEYRGQSREKVRNIPPQVRGGGRRNKGGGQAPPQGLKEQNSPRKNRRPPRTCNLGGKVRIHKTGRNRGDKP